MLPAVWSSYDDYQHYHTLCAETNRLDGVNDGIHVGQLRLFETARGGGGGGGAFVIVVDGMGTMMMVMVMVTISRVGG